MTMDHVPAGTFAFADLAGYSALTEAHGDDEAASLVARFAILARSELRSGEVVVKSIGDALMLRAPDPVAGLELVGRICAQLDAQPAFPELRTGLHHGPAVERDGDWYGMTVNIAARVAALAAGGQVLCTAVVAAAAEAAGVGARALGSRRLRHITEPVELYEVVPCPGVPDRVVDPVCHMAIDRVTAAGRLNHGGREFWFCSLACVGTFTAYPDRYLGGADEL